jgi:hypothetical protein
MEDAVSDTAILPSQFADLSRTSERTGELRLHVAILEDALKCCAFAGTRPAGRGRMERLRDEAQHWIAGAPAIIMFDDCCQAIGLDPDWIRRLISQRGVHYVRMKTIRYLDRDRSKAKPFTDERRNEIVSMFKRVSALGMKQADALRCTAERFGISEAAVRHQVAQRQRREARQMEVA